LIASYIFSDANNFTSVKEPYSTDDFVKSTYRDTVDTKTARARFSRFVNDNKLLAFLVSEALSTQLLPEDEVIEIVDCGVYMGTFTIAAGLMAQQAGLPVAMHGYEANPTLIESIRHNLEVYGVSAEVMHSGVGGSKGELEFVYPKGAMIGGTFFNVGNKKQSDGFTSVKCPILPLADILADDPWLGLIKLDIEGSEVAAFGSIMNNPRKMNNIFIIEYAPWQGKMKLPDAQVFADWVLNNFNIFNVSNWLYSSLAEIRTAEELASCLEGKNRKFNTDLLLIPQTCTTVVTKLRNGILE